MTGDARDRLVLVTGANGFVGSRLAARLCAEGFRVRALVRPSSNLDLLAGQPVEVVHGDVTAPLSLAAAVEGARWVFHLAATLRGGRESDFYAVNAEGTRNLVEACLRRAVDVERLVVVSTLAAVGPTPRGAPPATEETPEKPLTWYGASKLAGDRFVQAERRLKWTILRPSIVYGPGERDLLDVFRMARRGIFLALTGGRRVYSFVFVDDLVDALLLAARSPRAVHQVFLIAGPEIVGWREYGEFVAGVLRRRVLTIPVPEFAAAAAGDIADFVARAGRRAHIFGSQKVIEMRAPGWTASSAKATRLLGWTARTPLYDGLRRTVAWWRERGWL